MDWDIVQSLDYHHEQLREWRTRAGQWLEADRLAIAGSQRMIVQSRLILADFRIKTRAGPI